MGGKKGNRASATINPTVITDVASTAASSRSTKKCKLIAYKESLRRLQKQSKSEEGSKGEPTWYVPSDERDTCLAAARTSSSPCFNSLLSTPTVFIT
eukprot:scaffold64477_cov52-Attheya_sp.AAC.4